MANRGGKRPGAGRKKKDRVKIGITIRRDNAEYLSSKKDIDRIDKGLVVDQALDSLRDSE